MFTVVPGTYCVATGCTKNINKKRLHKILWFVSFKKQIPYNLYIPGIIFVRLSPGRISFNGSVLKFIYNLLLSQ